MLVYMMIFLTTLNILSNSKKYIFILEVDYWACDAGIFLYLHSRVFNRQRKLKIAL